MRYSHRAIGFTFDLSSTPLVPPPPPPPLLLLLLLLLLLVPAPAAAPTPAPAPAAAAAAAAAIATGTATASATAIITTTTTTTTAATTQTISGKQNKREASSGIRMHGGFFRHPQLSLRVSSATCERNSQTATRWEYLRFVDRHAVPSGGTCFP